MAAGIRGPGSMTAHRWARGAMPSARSIRSPRPGRCCRARATGQRAEEAMSWVERQLVRERERLILLFTPPFDKGPQQPGYIRGYVPGIRENGGQYTHAATWVVMATALLGQGNRAMQLFDILNPILHGNTPDDVQRYRVEPYVAMADVYSQPPHVGRGGWTWYTGSSGWLYRVGLESILGFRVEGDRLLLNPCVPQQFAAYEIVYRHRTTVYHIHIENPHGVERGVYSVELDGVIQEQGTVTLVDDGGQHEVRVVLGEPRPNGQVPAEQTADHEVKTAAIGRTAPNAEHAEP